MTGFGDMRRSLMAQKSGLIGVTPPQSAARNASVRTTAITMMTVFDLLNATTRSPHSGHFGTSWSKLTPQAGQVWRIGPPVPAGSSGIAGGYASEASGGSLFSLRIDECSAYQRWRENARNPWRLPVGCVNCDAPLPPPSPKGGRPRRFCSTACRHDWRYALKLERENPRPASKDAAYLEWSDVFSHRAKAERRVARWQRLREETHGERGGQANE